MDLEDERAGVGDDLGGEGEGVLDVLLGEDGHAGGDAPDQGQGHRTAIGHGADLRGLDRRPILLEDLQRAGLRLIPLDEPVVLQRGEVRVDG